MQEKFLTAYLSKNCENLMSDFTREWMQHVNDKERYQLSCY